MLSASLLLLATLSQAIPLRPRDVRADNDQEQVLFAASLQSTSTTHATPPSAPSVTSVLFAPDTINPAVPTPPIPQATPRPIVAAYYPDWTAAQLPPEKVDFDRLDWVDFAFAVPDAGNFTPKFLEYNSEDLLHRLVAAAHAKGKKVKLSIGGWTGSGHFSDAVNPLNRNAFAADIFALYNKFNVDGIDIDWEYPGEPGAVGNTHTPADTANFLAFLQLLRSLLPPHAYITAATQVWPFVDATGAHTKDISPFAQVLDWVLLMNYDVWGSSPSPGPNAPLSDACHNSSQPGANAHAAVKSWTAAGFPAHKIMLGLPAYGYVSRTDVAALRTRRAVPAPAPVAPINPAPAPAPITVTSEAGSAASGQVQFSALVAQGALRKTPAGAFAAAGGFERRWDACSSTPFLRSEAAGQVITYDDPESLALKAAFARAAGILGVNMWDAHGDTAGWDLVDGIRRGLGV